MKTVELASGKWILYPIKVYCYVSIKEAIQRLFQLPNFGSLCEEWCTLQNDVNRMHDIYDGRIWKDFQTVSGKSFLASPYNLALNMNVDWFQPFKLTEY